MTGTSLPDPQPSARVGRPARINREMIAAAAHEIGLDGLTLRAVADHLDVSIAALYHHVSGKDDLMRATAEYSAGRVPLPQDSGQNWAVWLLEWAFYNHDVFAAKPGLLAEYLDGAIGAEAMAPSLDRIMDLLVREGFQLLDANAAYELVAATSVGAVVNELRSQHVSADEDVSLDDYPHVRRLVVEVRRVGRRPFEERIVTVLRGIAAERGDDWDAVVAQVQVAVERRHHQI